MNLPPAILDLRVAPPDRRPLHLWLPIFLLWPLFLALAVIALVLTVLVDLVLLLAGERYHHYTLLLAKSLGAFTATRGLKVTIDDHRNTVSLTVL